MQPGIVQDDLIPAEQVFELDAADLRYRDLAGEQVVVGRDCVHRKPRRTRELRRPPAHPVRCARQRDDDMTAVKPFRQRTYLTQSP